MSGKVDVVSDVDGRHVVFIQDIRFKGRQNIEWEEVKSFLKEYVGSCHEIIETSDMIYIGSDFPEELKGSIDTTKSYGVMQRQKQMQHKRFHYCCLMQQIEDGKKI